MLISFIRTLILYFAVTVTVRLMGKRQVGELQNSEFVITLLISNLAAIPMQENGIPLLRGLIPIFTLAACEVLISACMVKSRKIRNLLCGHPVVIMQDGQILQRQLRRLRMTVEDLTEALRLQDIFDISQVQLVVVETNGKMSVQLKASEKPPTCKELKLTPEEHSFAVVVIAEGQICYDSLGLCHKSIQWLEQQLRKAKLKQEEIFLMTADRSGKTIIIQKEN